MCHKYLCETFEQLLSNKKICANIYAKATGYPSRALHWMMVINSGIGYERRCCANKFLFDPGQGGAETQHVQSRVPSRPILNPDTVQTSFFFLLFTNKIFESTFPQPAFLI